MLNIKELTEEEKQEAVDFMKFISEFSYEEFENYKKISTWWYRKLLNWCRIRHEYPELNEIWNKKFRIPSIEKKQKQNKKEIEKKMSIYKNQFINEHLIDPESVSHVKFRIVHHNYANNDEYMVLWIPFWWLSLPYPKFGYWFVFWRSECPDLFDEWIQIKEMRFDGSADVYSNIERYNRTYH